MAGSRFDRNSSRLAHPERLREPSGELREPVMLGRYRVLRWLRDTALAHVYICEPAGAGPSPGVELHVLSEGWHDDAEAVARFVRRGHTGRRLRHRGLPRVLEVSVDDVVPYAIHSWEPGPTLHQLQTEKGWGRSLDLRMVVRLAFDVADALAHAYLAEDVQGRPLALVHGGLSPDRVVVSPDGYARVVDFGTPAGTRYHAPELLAGGKPTPRTDVFALGVVLYALVTGQHAWPGHDVDIDRTSRLVAPRSVRSDIPDDLDALVRRCLETRPVDRPRDSVVLAELLSDWLRDHGGPVDDQEVADWEVEDAPSDGPPLRSRRRGGSKRIVAPGGFVSPTPDHPTWPRPAALTDLPTLPIEDLGPDAVTVPHPPALADQFAAPADRSLVGPAWGVVLLVGVATGGGLALAWFAPWLGLPSLDLWP